MADTKLLVKQLQLLIENPSSCAADDGQRTVITNLCRRAAEALERPFETTQRIIYSPLPLVVCRIGQDRNLFATLAREERPVGLQALSAACGLDRNFLETILDYLCSQDMVRKVAAQGLYAPTKQTRLLAQPRLCDAVTHMHDHTLPGFAALHDVLNDPGPGVTAFQRGHHTEHDFYTWVESRPAGQAAFHRFMETQLAGLPTWLEIVDFASEIGGGRPVTGTDAMLVDVGGGNGSQCALLRRAWPEMPGRLILQDRQAVVAKALEVPGMEKMSYDFFTEQPVLNARAYYFRHILHNHDDDTCVAILRAQMPAMGPDSVLVIDEKVLRDDKPPDAANAGEDYTAALSLAMKVFFDTAERRETHWREVVETRAGLVIADIRWYTKFGNAVIIAKKMES